LAILKQTCCQYRNEERAVELYESVLVSRQSGGLDALEIGGWGTKQEQKWIFRAASASFCLIRALSQSLVAEEVRILPEKSLPIFLAVEQRENIGTSNSCRNRSAVPRHDEAVADVIAKRGWRLARLIIFTGE